MHNISGRESYAAISRLVSTWQCGFWFGFIRSGCYGHPSRNMQRMVYVFLNMFIQLIENRVLNFVLHQVFNIQQDRVQFLIGFGLNHAHLAWFDRGHYMQDHASIHKCLQGHCPGFVFMLPNGVFAAFCEESMSVDCHGRSGSLLLSRTSAHS